MTNTINNHKEPGSETATIDITYYTDPLCCWSWAMEPGIRRLQYEFGERIQWRYVMGGLIPGWKYFNDPLNAVSRPAQMGPVWMHASRVSGMPVDYSIWVKNPPASSFLPCMAVKAVQFQSNKYAELYLRLLREDCMLNGVNISRQQELLKMARTLHFYYDGFDVERFANDLRNGKAKSAFQSDMDEVKSRNIHRFPTLLIRAGGEALLVSGYRPYEFLIQLLTDINPALDKVRPKIDPDDYRNFWPTITEEELRAATRLSS